MAVWSGEYPGCKISHSAPWWRDNELRSSSANRAQMGRGAAEEILLPAWANLPLPMELFEVAGEKPDLPAQTTKKPLHKKVP